MGIALHVVFDDEQQKINNRECEYDTFLQIWKNWQFEFPSIDPETHERYFKPQPPDPDDTDDVWTKIRKIQEQTSYNFRVSDVKSLKYFWMWVVDAKSARVCVDIIQRYYSHEDELIYAAKWLCFWSDRGPIY